MCRYRVNIGRSRVQKLCDYCLLGSFYAICVALSLCWWNGLAKISLCASGCLFARAFTQWLLVLTHHEWFGCMHVCIASASFTLICNCRDDVAVCYRKYLNDIGPTWEESLRKNAGIKSVRHQIARENNGQIFPLACVRAHLSYFLQMVPGCPRNVDHPRGL